jgi:hypothetical protein
VLSCYYLNNINSQLIFNFMKLPAVRPVVILALAVAVAGLHAVARPFPGLAGGEWASRLQARWRVHPDLRELDHSVDGFDLTVTGWIDAEEDREAVRTAVREVLPAGRGRVRDETEVRTPAWLVVETDGERISLHGESREIRPWSWLAAGGKEVSDQRAAHEGAAPEGAWGEGIGTVARVFLEEAERGSLEARGEEVVLAARFPGEAARARVLEAASAAWEQRVRVIDRSEVVVAVVSESPPAPPRRGPEAQPVAESVPVPRPEPVAVPAPAPAPAPVAVPPAVPAPRLAVRREGRVIDLSGQVRDYEERARVEAVVREQEPDLVIRNRIEVTDGLAEAGWLGTFGDWWPELVRRIPDVAVDVGPDAVEVGGGAAREEARREAEAIVRGLWGERVSLREWAAAP